MYFVDKTESHKFTMDKMLQLLCFALSVHLASGFFCHPKDIKRCLQPSLTFLQNHTSPNSSHPAEGLLQTAIRNYFSVLDVASESVWHTRSVKAVLVRLDDVFSDPDSLKEACGVFKETEKCLILKEDWCDGEVRDDLQDIENVFNILCHENYMTVFEANHTCLDSEALEQQRLGCDRGLAQELEQIGDIFKRPEHEEEDDENHVYGSIYGDLPTPDESIACRSIHGAVDCYVGHVKSTCGEELAKWEKRLRHTLVQMLLIDLNCQAEQGHFDYFEPLADESQYFVCASKEDYIPLDKKCDKTPDCRDQSDEVNCGGKAWTLVDILLISIGLTAALVIVVMCVVRWREDIASTLSYHLSLNNPREMQIFVNEEEMPGESTPPPGKIFHYDQLSPAHASNMAS